MSKSLHFFKALTTAGKPEDLTIYFEGAPPQHKSLLNAASFYDAQARLLGEALKNTLPGGTLDALLRHLLSYRASLLAVPFVDPAIDPAQQAQDNIQLLQQLVPLYNQLKRFIQTARLISPKEEP
jgi:hypothetical protein